MLALTCRRQPTAPGITLLKGILATLLLPATLWAGGAIITVPKPSGGDDTAMLQKALDEAVAKGPGTTVQLAAGTYLTRQLVAYDFRGTFRGAGEKKTTIEARKNLPVNLPNSFQENWPLPSATCHWPCLITFVDGDIRVSDLAVREPWSNGTATGPYINPTFGNTENGLYDVILFMGKNPTNVVVERVSIEGLQDDSDWGFNVAMGLDYSSYYPASSTLGDYCFLEGNFTVQNCSFNNMFSCVSFDGRHRDNRVIIGGSPDSGNVCENNCVALDLEPAQNAMFDVSFNRASAYWAAMWEYNLYSTNLGDFTPSTSYFLIHDNRFTALGAGTEGIWLVDNPASPWIRASIYNNKIDTQGASDGILLQNTKGASIWHNAITGTSNDAISLTGATQCAVIDNDFSGFTWSLADIYLDPGSSRNLVVCSSPKDTVQDLGTNDTIIIP